MITNIANHQNFQQHRTPPFSPAEAASAPGLSKELSKQSSDQPAVAVAPGWHVLWTRSNFERLVYDQLSQKGYEVFLPQIYQWSPHKEGTRTSRAPMFKGYLFVQHAIDKDAYLDICKTDGVVAILGARWDRLAQVPAAEIAAIRMAAESQLPTHPYPYLSEGDRVRITQGTLSNAEGILIRTDPTKGLFILSVNLLRRSVAVEVEFANVVPVL
ncbi:MAG: transcription termination/antitermination NusG family protein [Pseudomonadota bacterium]